MTIAASWRELARRGAHIVPLRGKRPIGAAWQSNPLAHEATLPRDADGFGLIPSSLGLLVIDCDDCEAPPRVLLREIPDECRATVKTPNGVHVYVAWPWPGIVGNTRWELDGQHGDLRHARGQVKLYDADAVLALCEPGALEPSDAVRVAVQALRQPRATKGNRNNEVNRRAFAAPGRRDVAETAGRLDGLPAREAATAAASGGDAGLSRLNLASPVSLSKHMPLRAKYCAPLKQWYLWTNAVGWERVDDLALHRAYNDWCWTLYERGELGDDANAALASLDKRNMVESVVGALRVRGDVAIDADAFDADPDLAGLTDGRVLDLRDGRTLEASPNLLVSRRLAVTPDDRPPDAWLQFLADMLPDAETIEYVRGWWRYCLTGRRDLHAMLFAYGPKGSGKSTFGELLHDLLGDYARTVDGSKLTARDNQGEHDAWMLPFVGTRYVYADEVESAGAWRSQKIKQLVTARTLSCRRIRGEPFDFNPQCKLAISGNEHPKMPRNDATWRRMYVLPMLNEVAEADQDPALPERLREELGGILQWAISGDASRVKTRTAAMQDAFEIARDDSDTLGAELNELLVEDVGSRGVKATEVIDKLNELRDAGDFQWTTHKLVPAMKRLGYKLARSGSIQWVRHVRWRNSDVLPF